MLSIKRIRAQREEVAEALHRRGPGIDLGPALEAEGRRLAAVKEHDELRHNQRVLSEVFRSGAPDEEKAAARGKLKEISDRVKELADAQTAAEEDLHEALLQIPNTPAPEVPPGETEDDNPVVREVLERPFIALAIDAADPCNGVLCEARFFEGDGYGALDKVQACVAFAANSKPKQCWVPCAGPRMGHGCADLQCWYCRFCLGIACASTFCLCIKA